MEKLEIKNLWVSVEGKQILKSIDLEIEKGRTYALMGPNGSGKTTLANAIMGHPKYTIEKGRIILNGEDITKTRPDERAKLGLFLSFQYPAEISGVLLSTFLRTCVNSLRKEKMSVVDFHKLLKEKMKELNIDPSFSKRYLNEGFSGGEKKKAEILQMSILNPKFALLDETDSGTDVDALKIISDGINNVKGANSTGILVITHYNRILKYLKPDRVIVMIKGELVDEGGAELADEIEATGYSKYDVENGVKSWKKEMN